MSIPNQCVPDQRYVGLRKSCQESMRRGRSVEHYISRSKGRISELCMSIKLRCQKDLQLTLSTSCASVNVVNINVNTDLAADVEACIWPYKISSSNCLALLSTSVNQLTIVVHSQVTPLKPRPLTRAIP